MVALGGKVIADTRNALTLREASYPAVTSKARRFGFHDLVDTEEMFLRMFSDFRRERIIP